MCRHIRIDRFHREDEASATVSGPCNECLRVSAMDFVNEWSPEESGRWEANGEGQSCRKVCCHGPFGKGGSFISVTLGDKIPEISTEWGDSLDVKIHLQRIIFCPTLDLVAEAREGNGWKSGFDRLR